MIAENSPMPSHTIKTTQITEKIQWHWERPYFYDRFNLYIFKDIEIRTHGNETVTRARHYLFPAGWKEVPENCEIEPVLAISGQAAYALRRCFGDNQFLPEEFTAFLQATLHESIKGELQDLGEASKQYLVPEKASDVTMSTVNALENEYLLNEKEVFKPNGIMGFIEKMEKKLETDKMLKEDYGT